MPTDQTEQPAAQGSGPWLKRRYYLDVARPRLAPAALMHEVQCHLPQFSPDLLADFEHRDPARAGCPLAAGDEFQIKILGPWNGCVRVTEVGPTFFEFVTLEGHPEAGRIRFEAHCLDERPDVLRFEIRSRARSRDGLVAFAYDTLGVGRRVQEATWAEFCRRAAHASGGETLGEVVVETARHDPASGAAQLERHASA